VGLSSTWRMRALSGTPGEEEGVVTDGGFGGGSEGDGFMCALPVRDPTRTRSPIPVARGSTAAAQVQDNMGNCISQGIARDGLQAGDLLAQRVSHQADEIVDVQSLHQLGAVGLDGLRTDSQDAGDSLDAAALRQKLEHLELTRGQQGGGGDGPGRLRTAKS